jgi:hypothetical protein
MDYKNKYLKYKNKYINLQKGGASQVKINYDDNDVKLYQQTQANSICLNSKNSFEKVTNGPGSFKRFLFQKLDDLMTENSLSSEINFDFVNLISAIPFNSNLFDIVRSSEGYKFVNDSLNYSIEKVIDLGGDAGGGGGGSKIIFLKRNDERFEDLSVKNYPEKLVLKLFNDDNTDTNYSPLVIKEVHDGRVEVPPADNRYQPIKKDIFYKSYNFDKDYKATYKDKNRGNDVYLGVPLNDFKNEIVLNTILEKIFEEGSKDYKDIKNLNNRLIKYYNFLKIQITDNTSRLKSSTTNYNAILMEKIDGTLYDLLTNQVESNKMINRDGINENFIIEFSHYINSLAYLKNNINRFTHTDLKSQNVFYRTVVPVVAEYGGAAAAQVPINQFLIADLDKSSVTYKGIRFYNGKLTSKMVNLQDLNRYFNQITEEISKTVTIGEDNSFVILPTSLLRTIFPGIETEQLLMRYSIIPFIPYFDFITLYCEMKFLLNSDQEEELDKSAIHHQINSFQNSGFLLKDLTPTLAGSDIDHSNFGKIIFQMMIQNQIKIPLSTNFIVKEPDVRYIELVTDGNFRSRIIRPITGAQTKLALSNVLTVSSKLISKLGGLLSSENSEVIARLNPGVPESAVKITYTGDTYLSLKEGNKIVKVNRFTKSIFGVAPKLYEYQIPNSKDEGGAAAVIDESREGAAAVIDESREGAAAVIDESREGAAAVVDDDDDDDDDIYKSANSSLNESLNKYLKYKKKYLLDSLFLKFLKINSINSLILCNFKIFSNPDVIIILSCLNMTLGLFINLLDVI